MKRTTTAMATVFLLSSLALATTPLVSANCDNYGNDIDIGNSSECTVNQNFCDGDSGPAGSGSGAGAGAGMGSESGAEASANASSSTECNQCAGDDCENNAVEPPGNDPPPCSWPYCPPPGLTVTVEGFDFLLEGLTTI